MNFVSTIIGTAEHVPLPDAIIRAGIHRLCSRTATRLSECDAKTDALFADEMAARAIAEFADEANAEHYEEPAEFFAKVLGPNRKYSSCFYKEPASTLQEADDTALWMRRWRWFFLATAGLFGHADGSEWGVSHYRMKAA
jgi:cyclopropane-fatty-acyl-phospholipid synthase